MKTLPGNIDQFLKNCASHIGEIEKDYFYRDIYEECLEYPNADHEMESPIEWIVYISLNALVKLNSNLKFAEPIETPTGTYLDGLFIHPQKRIHKYRIDFLISYNMPLWKNEEYRKKVLVECDSQEFHERKEAERRYEKGRDRFIQKKGYRIFKYTGREIIDQPFVVASEILSEVVPWAKGPDYFLDDQIREMKVKLSRK